MDEATPTAARLWPFFFIVLPDGISQGFLLVAFPYLASTHGVSMTAIGSIIGLAMLAVPLKVIWTPIVDLWLDLRLWVVLSAVVTFGLVTILLFTPLTPTNIWLIAPLAFAMRAASTFDGIAGSGLMALTIRHGQIGRAAGYYQGGSLVATGCGGGAMLWAMSHFGSVGALVVAAMLGAGGLTVLLVPEPVRPHLASPLLGRIKSIGSDLWSVASNRRGLYVIIAFCAPIGVGAASNIWGGFASEWGAGPTVVALASGIGFGWANALGSFLFGFCADRMDRVTAFLATGVLLAGAAILLAILPHTPTAFAVGALIYGLMLGCAYTSFTALSFEVIGKGAAASKMGVLNAIGNVPLAYMSPLLGWVHDRWSSGVMLWFEALFGLAFIVLFALLRVAIGWRPAVPAMERVPA